jgi:hypothetical protein
VKRPLVVAASSGYGLDRWRELYGSARNTNSVYRNPVRNSVVGGIAQSRHMSGDAVDLRNESRTEVEWQTMYDLAAPGFANADYREPRDGPCGIGCVHADWRYHNLNDYAQ